MCNPDRTLRRAARAGMTLVELLVAIVIASIFLTGIVGAISALLDSAEKAERRGVAVRHARSALNQLSEDLAQAATAIAPIARFLGTDAPLATGDRFDNDFDLLVDEEQLDGRNDDFGPTVPKHVPLGGSPSGPLFERPREMAISEVGDEGVDEDTVFQNDSLLFTTTEQQVSYAIETFDGQDNVLVRRVVDLAPPFGGDQIMPVAFDVLSFGLLYYDPNWLLTGSPDPWRTSWDNGAVSGPIFFPVTVFAAITVYAGDVPLAEFPPAQAFPTVTLETQMNLESVLADYHAQF